MKKSKRFFISGNMQPVFFNNYLKEQADKLGVRGHTRVLEDGRIEVFAEGNTDAVTMMEHICRQGHGYTQIKKVEVKDERFQDFKDFRILRI